MLKQAYFISRRSMRAFATLPVFASQSDLARIFHT
jgi:hypothetical protein